MGLCKCPRKKVTNLFCFEHRVNVCEHCLVASHEKCIVQSYLQWLQDSDYDPNCTLCGNILYDDKIETARLVCLHLFHWECLDSWANSFPAHTAPAGYKCPTCQEQIFPKPQHVSPIVDRLRVKLNKANWARAGLGLPLLAMSEPTPPSVHNQSLFPKEEIPPSAVASELVTSHVTHEQTVVTMETNRTTGSDSYILPQESESTTMARKPGFGQEVDERERLLAEKQDTDLAENKYKRRSAMDWLRRWLRSRSIYAAAKDPLRGYKRMFFFLLIIIIGLMTLITVITRVSHGASDSDPFLDPLRNPNIRVADHAGLE